MPPHQGQPWTSASSAAMQHQETGVAVPQQPYPQVLFRGEATAGLGGLPRADQPGTSDVMGPTVRPIVCPAPTQYQGTGAAIQQQPFPQVLFNGGATAGLGWLSRGDQPGPSGVMRPTVRPFASLAQEKHQGTGAAIQQQPYPQVLFRSEATAWLRELSGGKQPSASGVMMMPTMKPSGQPEGSMPPYPSLLDPRLFQCSRVFQRRMLWRRSSEAGKYYQMSLLFVSGNCVSKPLEERVSHVQF